MVISRKRRLEIIVDGMTIKAIKVTKRNGEDGIYVRSSDGKREYIPVLSDKLDKIFKQAYPRSKVEIKVKYG